MAWYTDLFSRFRSDSAIGEAVDVPELIDVANPLPKLFRRDSFENEVTGLGGSNDLTTRSVAVNRRALNCNVLTSLYRFDGYTRRFIDIVPDQATRKGWKVVARSADDNADEELMRDEEARLGINEKTGDALRWARLYGGSLIVIINGDANLAEPMDHDNSGEILNLAVFDRREISALRWNDDITSRNFREVEAWQVSPNVAGSMGFSGGEVHRSRVIYFPGAKLPPSVRTENWGIDDSVIEAAFNQLRNKSVLDDQMARLSHDARTRVLKLRGLDTKGLSDAREALMTRAKLIAQTINLTGIMLLLEGETFESNVDTISGWAQLDDKARQALSAVTAIPQTLLFGDAPSGLNTDGQSGRNNFGDFIAAVQNHLLRKRLTTLYKILMGSIDKQDVDWALEFNPFFEVTQQETANLRKTHMETDTGYINAGVLDPTDIAKSRFSERGWEPDIRPVDIDEVSARSALIEAEAELEAMSLAAETETAQTEAEIAEEELTEPATPEAEDEPDTQAQSGAE